MTKKYHPKVGLIIPHEKQPLTHVTQDKTRQWTGKHSALIQRQTSKAELPETADEPEEVRFPRTSWDTSWAEELNIKT